MSTDKFNLANISDTDVVNRVEKQTDEPTVRPLKRTEVWAWVRLIVNLNGLLCHILSPLID